MRTINQINREMKQVLDSLEFHEGVDVPDVESPADSYLDNVKYAKSLDATTCDTALNWNDRNDY